MVVVLQNSLASWPGSRAAQQTTSATSSLSWIPTSRLPPSSTLSPGSCLALPRRDELLPFPLLWGLLALEFWRRTWSCSEEACEKVHWERGKWTDWGERGKKRNKSLNCWMARTNQTYVQKQKPRNWHRHLSCQVQEKEAIKDQHEIREFSPTGQSTDLINLCGAEVYSSCLFRK